MLCLSIKSGRPPSLKGETRSASQHKLSPNQSAARMNRKQAASSSFQNFLPRHAGLTVVPGRILLVIGFVGCHGCPSLGAVQGREAPCGSTVLQPGWQHGLAPAVSHSHEHFLPTDFLQHPLPCFHVHFCSFH